MVKVEVRIGENSRRCPQWIAQVYQSCTMLMQPFSISSLTLQPSSSIFYRFLFPGWIWEPHWGISRQDWRNIFWYLPCSQLKYILWITLASIRGCCLDCQSVGWFAVFDRSENHQHGQYRLNHYHGAHLAVVLYQVLYQGRWKIGWRISLEIISLSIGNPRDQANKRWAFWCCQIWFGWIGHLVSRDFRIFDPLSSWMWEREPMPLKRRKDCHNQESWLLHSSRWNLW